MNTVTVDELFADLRRSNTFFSCSARRKRDKKVDGVVVEPSGTIYTRTYRLNVPATKKEAERRLPPGQRREEDYANGVITAYDVTATDKHGEKGDFRRINLEGVVQVRAKGKIWTPYYNREDRQWYLVEVQQ